jgi:cholesterol transport system auxiliary component
MRSTIVWFCVGGALAFCSGCIGVERSYPEKQYFVILAGPGSTSADPSLNHGKGVLLVSNLHVSPRYEGKSFVYRRSETGFEADFYNQFLISPSAIFTEEVRKALARAGLFEAVIGSASQLEPTHFLEGSVEALYGDFRDAAAPRAVLEMEFFVTGDAPAITDLVTHRRYRKTVPVSGASAEALVRAWSQALDEILAAFVTDLQKAL